MTKNRPPLPARWEFHLATTLLSIVLLTLQVHTRRAETTAADLDPKVGSRSDRRSSTTEEDRARAQLSHERELLRLFSGVWLMGRAYQLEHSPARPIRATPVGER